jgi:hypothetical protein
MAQALFISRDDIIKFTVLNGNIDTDKFIQFIKIAQDVHIQNYLGTRLFNRLNDDIVNDDLIEPYIDLLTTYIKPMLIHWAMVEFLPYAAYTVANKGVFKHNSENSTNVDKNEIDFLIAKERDVAQSYTNRFIDYMCFNQVSFPEYNANSNADVFPDKDANFTGWVI